MGVKNLVITATGDPAITDKVVKLSHAGVSFSSLNASCFHICTLTLEICCKVQS